MKENLTMKTISTDRFDVILKSGELERLTELTCGATEARIVRILKGLGTALAGVQGLPLSEQQMSWDRLATFPTIIQHYMPPALERGARLAVFDKNHATALPFLYAAVVLCDGWATTIAHLLIAACCKEQGDRAGMDAACDAFEGSRSSLESLELRSMSWRVPSLDPTGYDPIRGPEWFPDEAAALRYVRNAERRINVPESS